MKQEIIELIKKAFKKTGLPETDISLEHPGEEENGDYSSNIAMQYFKQIKNQRSKIKDQIKDKNQDIKSPYDLAKKIVSLLPKSDLIEKVEVAGPGFINFFLSKKALNEGLLEVLSKKDKYGKSTEFKGKKFMVEFAHPNTHKMFHIGHLRNITTGEAIVRILEANGAKVVRANYEGDIGMHIAKCLYSILQVQSSKCRVQSLKKEYKTTKERVEFLGKMYAEGNKSYEENEAAKKEIEDLNKKIYAKNPEVYELWKETRQWSLDYFETIYKRVNSHFDRYYFESEVFEKGKEIVLDSLGKGIFKKSEGAVIFPGEKFGLHNRVFVTNEGNATYEAKDMALGELQFKEYSPDLIIHVVGPEQAGYFQVIFKALAQIFPKTTGKEKHLIYGWVKLKHGKMSSRSGNVVLGDWLLDEAKKRIEKIMHSTKICMLDNTIVSRNIHDEVAGKVAVAAVKYSFLKVSLLSEIAFDVEESVSFEGDSGPYLQYTYARTQSVLRKIQNSKFQIPNKYKIPNSKNLKPEEVSLLLWIYRFPEVVWEAGKSFAPNLLCNFLFELCQRYNLFYNKLPILKAESPDVRDFRLALNSAVGQIIKNGLELLGIEAVERM